MQSTTQSQLVIVPTTLRQWDPPFFSGTEDQDVEDWLQLFEKSVEPTDASIAGRAPSRQKAKEDITLKEPEAAALTDTRAGYDRKPVNDVNTAKKDSAKSAASRVGLDDLADEVEDATGDSALEDTTEDDVSSTLREVYSTDGDASKMPQRGSSNERTKKAKSLGNNELDNQSESSASNTQNINEVLMMRPRPLPPSDFKLKGIMKL
ncbi:hypothetical protein HPB51_007376 [Rhipicephalus microplus]|uniref:Uncharacterized protein n=1 Tax=Rhipicephalus microplus TaxID=6941 RepID=A0A9J6EYF8_RHIMP|nr:hypothetical protein HPB51_007376 [Rhipicephalus microplus]